MSADQSYAKHIPELVEQVSSSFGPPDILVNATGVNFRESAENITLESWDKTLVINLRTPFFLAQSLFPDMRLKELGRIIKTPLPISLGELSQMVLPMGLPRIVLIN